MKLLKKIAILSAAGLAFGASNAQAQSHAAASFGTLTFTLVDLDLSDGITPSITYSASSSTVNARIYDSDGYSIDNQSDSSTSINPGISITSAYAGVTSTSIVNGTSVSVNGASVTDLVWFYGDAQKTTSYTLSANTGLIVSGTFTATVTGPQPTPTTYASLQSGGLIYITNAWGEGLAQYTGGAWTYTGVDTNLSEDFTLTVTNAAATELNGTILANVYQGGSQGLISTVPEPETYGMMMAGLGLLGVAARRKQRKPGGR